MAEVVVVSAEADSIAKTNQDTTSLGIDISMPPNFSGHFFCAHLIPEPLRIKRME